MRMSGTGKTNILHKLRRVVEDGGDRTVTASISSRPFAPVMMSSKAWRSERRGSHMHF
jgi:hypothetical protein